MGGKEYLTRFKHLGLDELRAFLKGNQPGPSWAKHLEVCLECRSKLANLRVKSVFDDHPETDSIRRYAEGELPVNEGRVVEQHLSSCASCVKFFATVKAAEMSWPDDDASLDEFEPPSELLSWATQRTTRMLRSAVHFKRQRRQQNAKLERRANQDLSESARQATRPQHLGNLVVRGEQTMFDFDSPTTVDRTEFEKRLLDAYDELLHTTESQLTQLQLTRQDVSKSFPTESRKESLAFMGKFWLEHSEELDRSLRNQAKCTQKVIRLLSKVSETFGDREEPKGAELTVPLSETLQCTVRADTPPDRSGIALTVSISDRTGKAAPGILVVLHSDKEIVDQLTDTKGRVVFPPSSGFVILRFGKTEFSLNLNP